MVAKQAMECRTYTTLISHVKGKGRLQQVVDWCGGPSFDGCIVFDECHKAKNFVPGKEAQSTKVSLSACVPCIQPASLHAMQQQCCEASKLLVDVHWHFAHLTVLPV